MRLLKPSAGTCIVAVSAVLALAAPAPGAVAAQNASVSGTVTDATGLPLPGVTVEARGPGGATFAVTDGTGRFTFSGLAPGAYEITFALSGFSAPAQVVEVEGGLTMTVDVEMAFGLQEQVVVVGTRAQPRSVIESTVPVDVITADAFASQGDTDLTNQLRTLVPSFSVTTQPIADAATIVRPISLRNLAPDHTLVLVNGKRRHRAAVITWLGNGLADGSQGPDISVIPSIALRQAEVLRDGASAQYGSDAIAGVLNFQMKDAPSGGSVEFQTGAYLDANDGSSPSRGGVHVPGSHAGAYTFAGNVGLPLGAAGFANLSLEYGNTGPTSRSAQRADALALIAAGNTGIRDPAQVWGSPRVEDDLKLFGNLGHLFANGVQWYGHANYASRKTTGGFFFRNPNTRSGVFSVDGGRTLLVGDRVWAATGVPHAGGCRVVPVVGDVPDSAALAAVEADPNCFTLRTRFPGGFTPHFGGNLKDYSVVTGVRGLATPRLTWDASASIGTSDVDQFIYDTVNASLGYDTPTAFSPGAYRQQDIGFNVDISYAASDRLNVAAGAEWRQEAFTIRAGDRPSWEIGPYATTGQGFSSGSNGFNGYRPENSGTWKRSNVAVYGDLELTAPDGRWTLGGAVRAERYADFGGTLNGKVSARVELAGPFALRGAVSTGFRAPTPGQQHAFNVSTAFAPALGDLVNEGTVPPTFRAAELRGGEQLRPETSRNYTFGAVVDAGRLTLTADYFLIHVRDRLALTRVFELTPAEIDSLVAEGVQEARNLQRFRFFANDFSTRSQGIDLVSTLALRDASTISVVYNHTATEVTEWTLDTIDAFRRQALEAGLPENRWSVLFTERGRSLIFMARLNYFGAFWDRRDSQAAGGGRNLAAAMWPLSGGKPLLDLEVGFPFGDALTLSVGAQNVLNTYPDETRVVGGPGNLYPQGAPFGFNGAYYYARVNYGWGGAF